MHSQHAMMSTDLMVLLFIPPFAGANLQADLGGYEDSFFNFDAAEPSYRLPEPTTVISNTASLIRIPCLPSRISEMMKFSVPSSV